VVSIFEGIRNFCKMLHVKGQGGDMGETWETGLRRGLVIMVLSMLASLWLE
jgi:hypothetical protein